MTRNIPDLTRCMKSWAEKEALIASGKPFVVAAREVAKCTKHYRTDPEIILACVIVSGTLDTSVVIRTEILLINGCKVAAPELAAHNAFRRVWASPTEDERAAVLQWACRIAAAAARTQKSAKPDFLWSVPQAH